MRRVLILISMSLASAPAAAEEAAPMAASPAGLAAGGGAGDPILQRLFEGAARPGPANGEAGLVGSSLGTIDALLEKLGIDRDELTDALSEVEISGAEENWRDESSGEIGLSFGITDRFSVGPSFGLSYEEENLAGPDDEWSQQLKLGARFNF